MNNRSEALAARLEAGATALAAFAATLSEAEWQTRLPKDGRKIGVVVHHVASVYPIEIQLASLLAAGQPITGVTWDAVDTMNRDHAKENDGVTKEASARLVGRPTVPRRPRQSALSAMKSWIAPRPCRSIAMLRSPASSCLRIMRCATVTTISLGSGRRSAVSTPTIYRRAEGESFRRREKLCRRQ